MNNTQQIDATIINDKKSNLVSKIITITAISMSLFHIYTAIFGLFNFVTQRGVHLAFAITILLLQKPLVSTVFKGRFKNNNTMKKIFFTLDILMIVLMWIGIYIAQWEYKMRVIRAGKISPYAIYAGFFMLIILLEASRRQLGLILPSLAIISIIYAWAGPYMPLIIRHRGYDFDRIFGFLAANPDGMFGITVKVSATVIFMFVLFGAFLETSGASDFVNNFAMSLTGRRKSGPSMAAVIASALMGTINGSAVANVVGTGTFTIPLMKKQGYKPEFAAAVESVASTGGQILPPVMGAGAFIMVVFTEIAYTKIIVAAAIPAILYFSGILMALMFRSERLGLQGLPADKLPDFKETLKSGLVYIPPIIILIYCLLIASSSPMMAAFYAAVAIPVSLFFNKEKRFNIAKILEALETAAKNALTIVLGCACAGIVVAMVAITGLGVVFSDMMFSLSGGNLILALLFTALACIILGMGLPTTAAYVIAASIVAPALTRLGVPVLGAHLFVFYFACLSAITPPVALAAYAGAGIAQANPMITAIEACKLGFAGFVVPFIFATNGVLLAKGSFIAILWAFISALIGAGAMSAGFQGFLLKRCNILERAVLLISGLAAMHPDNLSNFLGLGIIALVIIFQLAKKNKKQVLETR